MNKPLILAFGYEARSGKGECCDTIYRQHSLQHGGRHDILRISFATRLREEIHNELHFLAASYRMSVQDAMKLLCQTAGVDYDPDAPVSELDPYGKQRKLLQWWGTEYRRAQDKDYWLNAVADKVRETNPAIVLIDDLRFANEYEWVVANDGITVKTSRLGATPIQNGIAGHASEGALANHPFEYFITAYDGQLSWLRSQALHLFDFLTTKHTSTI